MTEAAARSPTDPHEQPDFLSSRRRHRLEGMGIETSFSGSKIKKNERLSGGNGGRGREIMEENVLILILSPHSGGKLKPLNT